MFHDGFPALDGDTISFYEASGAVLRFRQRLGHPRVAGKGKCGQRSATPKENNRFILSLQRFHQNNCSDLKARP
jgi:hypothetical protein